MIFFLTESLVEEKRQKDVVISMKSINIWGKVKKWSHIPLIKYTLVMRIFIFSAFIIYTTVSALYLIDVFWFSADKVWYYLTFTGTFLILHQAVSIRYIVWKFGDTKALLMGIIIIAFWYLGMALSGDNIVAFTVIYFFGVLGISICLTTLWALSSNAADEKNQWEVLGMMTGVESMISIAIPIIATALYGVLNFSIYFIVSALAFLALIVSRLFFRNIHE
jgi:DHA1 family tetracycline resistance protein-like MFS transporter